MQKNAIETGKVTVNGKQVPITHPIKNGDVVSHTLHRHEPPVTALPIGIIHEDNDMIAIDKPAGVPVHPAGRYNYNSIIEIMRAERGHQWNPLPCNRLDRLTSGVMFIGKNAKAADILSGKLRSRTVEKEYLARVKGKFPDGVVLCDQPIMKISPMLGLNRARASGKDAKTKFRRLAYYPSATANPKPHSENDPATPPAEICGATPSGAATPPAPASDEEGYSIIHCFPLTGRTHQIRVHLQYLGYPIINDPIYSNRRVFGHSLGRADASGDNDKEIVEALEKMGKSEMPEPLSYQTFQTPPPERVTQGNNDAVINDLLAREHDVMIKDYLRRKGEKQNGLKCETCGTDLYSDPGVHELGIFLHAASYKDTEGEWHYRSKMPNWAMPPEGMEGPTSVPEWHEEGEELVVGTGQMEEALVEGVGIVSIDEARKKDDERNKSNGAESDAPAAAAGAA